MSRARSAGIVDVDVVVDLDLDLDEPPAADRQLVGRFDGDLVGWWSLCRLGCL